MKSKSSMSLVAVVFGSQLVVGCVSSGTHNAALSILDETKTQLKETAEIAHTTQNKLNDTEQKLGVAMDQNDKLVRKVKSMGQNVEQLLGEKDQLAQQREKLAAEVAELQRLRAAAEARNAEFKDVLKKLHKMIDAGSLEVKIRNGHMLVRMSSDVLFAAGSARLKPAAVEAIRELALTVASFPERKFQVIGHSDSTPMSTPRFPSNWELSSQRAIEVVKVMIDAGVPPEMLSAAGAADTDPLVSNDTYENKALNRRVEVIFVPKIDELPGFDAVLDGQ